MYKKISGVYKIQNTVNGKCYIGSAISIKRRWCEHRRNLSRGVHHSDHLQKSWNKYGVAFFIFEIIEECTKDCLIRCEQYWMDLLNSADPDFGYNCTPVAGSMLGFKHSDSTKAFLSTVCCGPKHPMYGKPLSKEHRDNMSRARMGKKISEETKKKISFALSGPKSPKFGRPLSDETKRKLSEINKGKTVSEEIKQKISKSTSGEKNHFYGKKHSEETKRRLSRAKLGPNHPNFGVHLSEGHRKKISEANIGKVHSKSTRKKISEAKNPVRYDYQGESLTISELSVLFGINRSTLNYRLNTLGWTVEQALFTTKDEANKLGLEKNRGHNHRGYKRAKLYEYQGKTQPLSDWAKEYNINQTTLGARIKVLGWTLEQALKTPVRGSH